jgi:hypothetical protein
MKLPECPTPDRRIGVNDLAASQFPNSVARRLTGDQTGDLGIGREKYEWRQKALADEHHCEDRIFARKA